MRKITVFLSIALFLLFISGCQAKPPQASPSPTATQKQPSPTQTVTSTETPESPTQVPTDAITSASIVNNADAFEESISKGGTWIICLISDISTDKELVVEGEFKNTKDPPVSQRKLALYAQDEERNVTARYTLTAPKMTILSPDAAIWYGTFKGDLYVSAKNFQLKGATVDGNIYFTTEEAQSTFIIDADSKVTGKQELKK